MCGTRLALSNVWSNSWTCKILLQLSSYFLNLNPFYVLITILLKLKCFVHVLAICYDGDDSRCSVSNFSRDKVVNFLITHVHKIIFERSANVECSCTICVPSTFRCILLYTGMESLILRRYWIKSQIWIAPVSSGFRV